MEVAEPTLASATAPLGGEDDEIERVSRLDLEPGLATAPGFVSGLERFGHESFMALADRAVEEGSGFLLARALDAGDEVGLRQTRS